MEDGKNIFKLRLRLCSSLYPTNERVRDFCLEYDRHTLQTRPPWGSELLQVSTGTLSHLIYFSLLALLTCSFYSLKAINSLKHVDSTALLQFLYPILNMLLHLIGNGGETLQVFQLKSSSSLA